MASDLLAVTRYAIGLLASYRCKRMKMREWRSSEKKRTVQTDKEQSNMRESLLKLDREEEEEEEAKEKAVGRCVCYGQTNDSNLQTFVIKYRSCRLIICLLTKERDRGRLRQRKWLAASYWRHTAQDSSATQRQQKLSTQMAKKEDDKWKLKKAL